MTASMQVQYRDLGIEWRYDADAGAGYLLLHPKALSDRTVQVTPALNYDVDIDGRVIGVEMIRLGETPSWLTLARVLKHATSAPSAAPVEGDEK